MATRTKNRKARTSSTPAPRRPGPRGWSGRGGGASTYVQAPEEWRATTNQACGLWPFAAGTGSPMSGVPLGRNLLSGATLCGDPISWFQDAKLINNPSCFVLGLPAYGKSTLVRRMTLGLAGYGVVPLILGDLKPDYVDLVEALGGQVIRLGRARGYLNVLDPGEATAAAARLTGRARHELIADARGRRHTMVSALITIVRSAPPDDREETFLDRALQVLDERHPGIPVLRDLVQVLEDAPDIVREVALDRGNIDRYRDLIENLLVSLKGMQGSGRVGEIFSEQTTTAMRRDVPVVFDVSSIKDTELHLQGAALMACWSTGFGAVNVAHALSDAGLEPARNYWIVLDEVWRSLRAGLVDNMDGVTRLNRNEGVGQAMITHTMSDLEALPREEDRMKARGFVERAGMVLCGALPPSEFSKLRRVMAYSDAEEEMVAGWTNPPAWDSSTGAAEIPPGCGNFLVKVGGRPGIPFRVVLTNAELGLHDTNKRWHTKSRIHEAPEFAQAPATTTEVAS
jgi:hypothetical protein